MQSTRLAVKPPTPNRLQLELQLRTKALQHLGKKSKVISAYVACEFVCMCECGMCVFVRHVCVCVYLPIIEERKKADEDDVQLSSTLRLVPRALRGNY